MSGAETARRQYVIEVFNRCLAHNLDNLDRSLAPLGSGSAAVAAFMCACGRPVCRELLTIALADYDRVRSSPDRFVIFPGHATEINEVVDRGGGFEIVELRPEFRVADPPTARPGLAAPS
jgi:hypothetical protein